MRRVAFAVGVLALAWCAWAIPPVIVGSGGGWRTVSQPAGFSQTLPFIVQTKGGVFRAWDSARAKVWDPADNAPAVSKTYYVALTGDDGAAGTIDAPLRKIKTAIAKADVDRIIIQDAGPYDQDTGSFGQAITRSMSIIGHTSGTVITGCYSGLSWSLVADKTYTYTASQANAGTWAFDAANLDGNGDYSRLTIQTSIDAVEAAAGSIYINGSDIYVRTLDDRTPDNDVRISNNSNDTLRSTTNGITVYLEDLKVYGGRYPLYFRNSGAATAVYAKDCEVAYGNDADNAFIYGIDFFALRVESFLAQGDGFNYNTYSGNISTGTEVECIGRHNGKTTGTPSNNGTTCHDAATSVLLNSEYYGNQGRNAANVTAGLTWALGCNAHDSGTATSTYDENWSSQGAGTVMWLHGCNSSGSTTDIRADTDGVVYLRNWLGGTTYIGTPGSY